MKLMNEKRLRISFSFILYIQNKLVNSKNQRVSLEITVHNRSFVSITQLLPVHLSVPCSKFNRFEERTETCSNLFETHNLLSRFETILNHRYIYIYIRIPWRDSLAGSNELANKLRILLFLVSASVMLARHATQIVEYERLT